MENLIRIKLDPKRGLLSPINFIRPCFVIYDWPGDEADVWFSDNNGLTWGKLGTDDFRAGYDFEMKRLYLSLLFDIDTISQVAIFGSGGTMVGAGYTIREYRSVQVGWNIEGIKGSPIPVGCSEGNELGFEVGVGATIDGALTGNIPAGYFVKCPFVRNFMVGYMVAGPIDTWIAVGFDTGTVFAVSQGVGATIMGLSEYGLDFMLLDEATIGAMSGEAVHRKQKIINLNETIPEELD
jgi:hypothetical protein